MVTSSPTTPCENALSRAEHRCEIRLQRAIAAEAERDVLAGQVAAIRALCDAQGDYVMVYALRAALLAASSPGGRE